MAAEKGNGLAATNNQPAKTTQKTNAIKIIAACAHSARAAGRFIAEYASLETALSMALMAYMAVGFVLGFSMGGIAK